MEEIEKMIEKMDRSIGMMGKTNLLQVSVNLTAISIREKMRPKEVVDVFFDIIKELFRKKEMW